MFLLIHVKVTHSSLSPVSSLPSCPSFPSCCSLTCTLVFDMTVLPFSDVEHENIVLPQQNGGIKDVASRILFL